MDRTILVVDDEEAARYAVRRVFSGDYRVIEAESLDGARKQLSGQRIDLVLLDYNLPDGKGSALLEEMAMRALAPTFIMITAHGSERVAVDAMKAGAYDYLAKPYDLDEMRLAVARAMEHRRLKEDIAGLRDRLASEGDFGSMSGVSRQMRELFLRAQHVAASDLPVLILGESGTGKELLAREIHARSARSEGPFIAVNCAALPETLVESELFGHEKGAFTHALASRPGKFEQANQGTLFLDEIGDMEPLTQAKILRAVECNAVERLGATRPIPVNFRLISATNRTPEQCVSEGRLRKDLYFRVAAVTLWIPPLASRREDIPCLVTRYWSGLQRKYGREGPKLEPDGITRLQAAGWPGNVRELRSVVERLFILTAGEGVGRAEVEAALEAAGSGERSEADDLLHIADYREARRRFEISYLASKLREHGGNITRTAEAVGLARQHLQEKIKELGIVP